MARLRMSNETHTAPVTKASTNPGKASRAAMLVVNTATTWEAADVGSEHRACAVRGVQGGWAVRRKIISGGHFKQATNCPSNATCHLAHPVLTAPGHRKEAQGGFEPCLLPSGRTTSNLSICASLSRVNTPLASRSCSASPAPPPRAWRHAAASQPAAAPGACWPRRLQELRRPHASHSPAKWLQPVWQGDAASGGGPHGKAAEAWHPAVQRWRGGRCVLPFASLCLWR
jgi:hypothetical protein